MNSTIVFLNEMGDIEVSWDSEHDTAMRALVEKKMAEGVRFFVLKPIPATPFYRKAKLKTVADLKENRVKVSDPDIMSLFEAQKVALTRTNDTNYETEKVAKTHSDLVGKKSVAVRPLQGG